MKNLLFLLSGVLFVFFFMGCTENSEEELADQYIGTWIAQTYDVDGTVNDYTLSDLTYDLSDNKTYKLVLSKSTFTQFNKAGTLKIQCSLSAVTDSFISLTVTDEGLENLPLGDTIYWEIIDSTTDNGITMNAYMDSNKDSGIVGTYTLLPE